MDNLHKITRHCSLLVLTLLVCLPSFAQSFRSTISGFVFDPERRPVSQVYVELNSEYRTLGRVRTDGSGRYYFSGLGPGRYKIRILTTGTNFSEQSEEVEIAGIGVRGQPLTDNILRDIYLRLRRNANNARFQNAVLFAQEIPKEAQEHFDSAIKDLASERTDAGIEGLQRAIGVFPEFFAALERLGVLYLRQGRFAEAATAFMRATTVNPRSFDSSYGLSYSEYQSRNFNEAVRAGEVALSLKRDSVEANLILGMSYRAVKNFRRAEEVLKDAAKLGDGKNADVHWHLALLYGKDLNRFAEAAKQLETYLKIAKDAPNADEIRKLIKFFKAKSHEAASPN